MVETQVKVHNCSNMDEECLVGIPQPKIEHSISSTHKLLFGLLIVLGIALTWVGATQTAQSTYTAGFNAPFLTIWLSTSCTILIYFPFMVYYCLKDGLSNFLLITRRNTMVFGSKGINPTSLSKYVLPFVIIWLITNYCYVKALLYIAAADVTAIFSSCSAFVYIFSLIILKEPFSLIRVVSVTLALSGIVLMASVDGFSSANLEGVLLSVLSAVGAALYKVTFKRVFGEPEMMQVALFLSLLGLLNLLCFWPIWEILYYTNCEYVDWYNIPWKMLLSSASIGLVFNFLINFGVSFTFPLFISLGTVLGIPINAFVDAWFRNKTFGVVKAGASCLVIVGFLLMLLPIDIRSRCKQRTKRLSENGEDTCN